MAKHRFSSKKAFTSPGSLIYTGKESNDKIKIRQYLYNEERITEYNPNKSQELAHPKGSLKSWIQINGIHNVTTIESIGKLFNLHPLLLEDVLNTSQRPKLDLFGDNQISVILKSLEWDSRLFQVKSNQTALILSKNLVLSIQESTDKDIFNAVEIRLKASVGKTRSGGSDYLFYTLCDTVTDTYFLLLDDFSELLENLEQSIIEKSREEDLQRLYTLRSELSFIRKSILPLRDVFLTLTRDDNPLISESTDLYFRDLFDHILQILESIDYQRETIDNIQNIYLNIINNKMNSVMKTLTVFTAIFMPLGFLAGIYGMNFVNMPELQNPNGYFFTLGAMFVIGVLMWLYFKWKKYM